VEEMTRFINSDRVPSTFNNEMRTFTSVSNELCLFLTARIELIDLYPSEIKKHIYKLQERTGWIEFED
jgi:hypothetical protein